MAGVVRVGVGVIVRDPKGHKVRGVMRVDVICHWSVDLSPVCKVFAGIRRGSHGEGTLALPGGHLEMYETFSECAIRETLEETGLEIQNLQFGHLTNDPMQQEGKHYVTIYMMAECKNADARPTNLEPHKCSGWDSFSWEELKKLSTDQDGSKPKLFGPLLNLVRDEPKAVVDFVNKSA